eukprot:m.166604 g.166604  ORF g.166604 m.166604 type:complete len:64 (-) comp14444_c0_seq3:1460-1651(-)
MSVIHYELANSSNKGTIGFDGATMMVDTLKQAIFRREFGVSADSDLAIEDKITKQSKVACQLV